ncbi:MAG: hypothetical protein HQ518_18020 [Rhodopirellula sp.]|nr:hypothetical protein [Rhodopirellula sp.]
MVISRDDTVADVHGDPAILAAEELEFMNSMLQYERTPLRNLCIAFVLIGLLGCYVLAIKGCVQGEWRSVNIACFATVVAALVVQCERKLKMCMQIIAHLRSLSDDTNGEN